jgi:RNA-directed DNA polymerase
VTIFYASKKSQKRLRERIKKVLDPQAPVTTVEQVQRANRILRGWVQYFRYGNSSEVFHDVRHHVEMKLRRVLQRKARRYGLGWKRYDHAHIYRTLGLYDDYRVRWQLTTT